MSLFFDSERYAYPNRLAVMGVKDLPIDFRLRMEGWSVSKWWTLIATYLPNYSDVSGQERDTFPFSIEQAYSEEKDLLIIRLSQVKNREIF